MSSIFDIDTAAIDGPQRSDRRKRRGGGRRVGGKTPKKSAAVDVFRLEGDDAPFAVKSKTDPLADIPRVVDPQQQIRENLDRTESARVPYGRRFAALQKTSLAGQLGYLRQTLPRVEGFEGVEIEPLLDDKGDIQDVVIRTPGEDRWRPLDAPFLHSLGSASEFGRDIVELIPDLAQGVVGGVASTAGGVAGGTLGSAAGPAGTVAGGIAGASAAGAAADAGVSALRQGVSEFLLPGDDQMTLRDRAGRAGTEALLGLGGELVGQGLRGVYAGARRLPFADQFSKQGRELAKQTVLRAGGREGIEAGTGAAARRTAQSGARGGTASQAVGDPDLRETTTRALAREQKERFARAGVTPTAGQLTGNEEVLGLEGVLRAAYKSPDADLRVRQAKQTERFLDKTIDAVVGPGGKRLTAGQAGDRVAGALRKNIDDIIKARSAAARDLFGKAFEESGGRAAYDVSNFKNTASELLREARNQAKGSAQNESFIGTLSKIIQDLDERGTVDAEWLSNTLSTYSRAAAGSGKVFPDLEKAAAKRPVRELFGALKRDLEAAAVADVPGARYLQAAREAYRDMSGAIEKRKISSIKKMLKLDADMSAAEIPNVLGKASPRQQRQVFKVLDQIDPQMGREVRGAMLGDIMRQARPRAKTLLSQRGVEFDPGRFAALAKNKDSLEKVRNILSNDPASFRRWKEAADIAEIVSRQTTQGGSNTATKQWYQRLAEMAAGGGAAARAAAAVGSLVTMQTSPKKMMTIITTPELYESWIGLARPRPSFKNSAAIARSLIRFAGLASEYGIADPQSGVSLTLQPGQEPAQSGDQTPSRYTVPQGEITPMRLEQR